MTYLKLNVIFLKNSGQAFTKYSPTGLFNLRCLALEREEMDIVHEVDKERVEFTEKQAIRRIPGKFSLMTGIVISLFIMDRRILLERGDFHF